MGSQNTNNAHNVIKVFDLKYRGTREEQDNSLWKAYTEDPNFKSIHTLSFDYQTPSKKMNQQAPQAVFLPLFHMALFPFRTKEEHFFRSAVSNIFNKFSFNRISMDNSLSDALHLSEQIFQNTLKIWEAKMERVLSRVLCFS